MKAQKKRKARFRIEKYAPLGAFVENRHLSEGYIVHLTSIIIFVMWLFNALLALRFLSLLFGAKTAGFALVLYYGSFPLVLPFKNVFPVTYFGNGQLETAALIAIGFYSLFAIVLIKLLDVFKETD